MRTRFAMHRAVFPALAATLAVLLSASTVVAAPAASFTYAPSPFYCGDALTFDGGSTDPGEEDTIASFEWDLDGDGAFDDDTGQIVTLPGVIASMDPVTYGLFVTTADEGATDDETLTLAPTNRTPIADAGGPYVVDSGTSLMLDASGSSDPDATCGDSIVQYRWDFMDYTDLDGFWDYNTASATLEVTWPELVAMGLTTPDTEYDLKLRVVDEDTTIAEIQTTFIIYVNEPTASFTTDPNPALCNQDVTFDPTGSSHGKPGQAIVQWEWDWDDDGVYDVTAGTGATQSHAFTTFGPHTVTLQVTDNNDPAVTDTEEVVVTVNNRNPTALTGGPYISDVGSSLVLDASASTDPDGDCGDSIVTYEWDIDPDFLGYEISTPSPTYTVPWALLERLDHPADADDGTPTNTITLRVTDSQSGVATAQTTITIYSNEPVASFTAAPNPAACNQNIAFDASGSSHGHPDFTVASYAWDWDNDGNYDDFGATAVHFFDQYGTYPVTLRVRDNNPVAREDTTTVDIVVNQGNTVPVAEHGGPYEIEEGDDLTLDASSSSEPDVACGDSIVTYEWDIDNDKDYDYSTTDPTLLIPWADMSGLPGPTNPVQGEPINTVWLRITDSLGGQTEVETTLSIYRNQPVASFTRSVEPAACGQAVTFDGSGSYHGSVFRDIALWQWDWDSDGTYDDTGQSVVHIFSQFGTYEVTLRVTDDNDPPRTALTTLTTHVTEGNTGPTANAGGPYEIEEYDDVVLDASLSSDPNVGCGDSIVEYQWDLNNDGTYDYTTTSATQFVGWEDLRLLQHPTNPQSNTPSHTVTLLVTDSLGLQQTATTQLRIYRNHPVASFTATPNPAECNQLVTFDETGSYHGFPAQTIVLYEWDFDNDGVFEEQGAGKSKAFNAFGSYPITLRVTDNNVPAKTSETTRTVNVTAGNRAPTAEANGPYETTIGIGVTLQATGSVDPDEACGDSLVKYEWDLGSNGTWDHETTTAELVLDWAAISGLPHPADPETGLPFSNVTLRVTDEFGATATDTTTLTIYDDRPVASFTATPNPAACGQTVAFDGSGSLHGDPKRTIVEWAWDLDADGTFETLGQTPSRTYNTFGAYDVTLRVTDDDTRACNNDSQCGGTCNQTSGQCNPQTATRTVTINVTEGNNAPVAAIDGPYSLHEGDLLSISAADSADPDTGCGDRIALYELDLNGDGVYEANSTLPTFEFLWGEYRDLIEYPADPVSGTPLNNVALRVTDTFGVTKVTTTTLRVYRNEPTAAFTLAPNPAACGAEVTLDASLSRHESPLQSIARYEWDISDDGTVDFTGPIVTTTFASFGSLPDRAYPIRLTVTDDNGTPKTDTIAYDLVVDQGNEAPTAHDGGPYAMDEGDTLVLDASASTDPNTACGDSIVEYAWDLDSNGVYDHVTPDAVLGLTWAQVSGLQRPASPVTGLPRNTVTLRTTDSFGRTSVDATTLTIYRNEPTAAFTVSANPASCGQELTFDATSSRHESALHDIVQFAWDFDGDGFPDQTGAAGTHRTRTYTFTSFGTHEVTLDVTDNNTPALSDSATVSVNVNLGNEAPTANPGGPYQTAAGSGVTLSAAGSTEPNLACGDSIVSYDWDVDGDGAFEFSETSPGLVLTWAQISGLAQPADPSTGIPYNTITLRVTDEFGATGTATTALRIYDNAPIPCFTATPNPTACGSDVVLSPACSQHANPTQNIVRYDWDLDGDGEYDDASTTAADDVTHQFTTYGNVVVGLRVTDDVDEGQTATTTVTVAVSEGNEAPVADAGGPYVGQVGGTVTLDATASRDPNSDCGDEIVLYEWDLDADADGLFERRVGNAPTLELDWAVLGNLAHPADPQTGLPTNPIRLRVTDSFGETHIAASTITIYENAPVAAAEVGPSPAACGQTLTFSAVGSYHGDPAHSIVSYAWDIDGDGTTDRTEEAFAYAYPAFGTYAVTLTVTDDNDPPITSTDTATVVVDQGNRAPVADPGGPYVSIIGANVTLDATASVDPDESCGDLIAQYLWDIDGDGTTDYTNNEALLTVPWARLSELAYPANPDTGAPSNQLTLTVIDKFGASHVATTTLTIYANEPVPCASVTPSAPDCGQGVVFDAACSRHLNPAQAIVSYEWDLDGDGVYEAEGQTVGHLFTEAGLNIASLRVTDDNDPPIARVKQFEVTMDPGANFPIADAGGPYNLQTNNGATLSAAGSRDPDAGCGDRIVEYAWDLDGDGAFDGQWDRVTSGDSIALQWGEMILLFPYPADPETGVVDCAASGSSCPGGRSVATVTLRVTDSTGRTDFSTVPVAVYENQPDACYVGTLKEGKCGLEYSFDASCTRHGHPDHGVVDYYWDLVGDYEYDRTGESFDFIFPAYGTYTVKLKVADDNDPVREDIYAVEYIVQFNNTEPTPDTGGPYVIRQGEALALDAGDSTDYDSNCGDTVAHYAWDLNGDGTFDVQGTEPLETVTAQELVELGLLMPADPISGEPTNVVTLQVTDTNGLASPLHECGDAAPPSACDPACRVDELCVDGTCRRAAAVGTCEPACVGGTTCVTTAGSTTTLAIYGTEPVACIDAEPNPAGCGESVALSGSCAWHRDPDRTVVAWAWDFDGDGVDDAFGEDVAHAFDAFGTYPVRLTVTDDSVPPKTAQATLDVASTADNSAPLADTGGPYAATVGETLTLDGSASLDPNETCDDRVVEWAWDFDSDGLFDLITDEPIANVPWSRLVDLPHPADPDSGEPASTLTLRVTDSLGATDTATTTLALYDNEPLPCFAVEPAPSRCGESVSFDARCTRHGHPDHTIIAWNWDLDGDGSVDVTGPNASRTFDAFGQYDVTLTVRDDAGVERQLVQAVSVTAGNRSPRANAAGPYGVAIGEPLALDASASFEPDAGCLDSIVLYEWDLDNDGTFDVSGTSPTTVAPPELLEGLAGPADPETGDPRNPITLRVTDTFGLTDIDTTTLSLYEDRPHACFQVRTAGGVTSSPPEVVCAQSTTLDATCSWHGNPARNLVRWEWDLDGDGDFDDDGQTVSHEFPEFGTVRVRLRVHDDAGQVADQIVVIDVNQGNVAPVADAGGPYVVDLGAGELLDASATREPNAGCGDEVVLYQWDLNQDGVFDHQSASAELPVTWPQLLNAGLRYPADPETGLPTNPITVRVTDSFGLTATDQTTLTIYDNRPLAAFEATPNPAGCNQTVTFDARASSHGHPGHANVEYIWNFGDGSPEEQGVTTLHNFERFGTYAVRLRVRDDNVPQAVAEVVHNIDVSAANQAPIPVPLPSAAPVAGAVVGYEMDWGADLLLDASDSLDPDEGCGDRIVEYAWDYGATGFYDVREVESQRPVPWELLRTAYGIGCCEVAGPGEDPTDSVCETGGLQGCADPDSGEPSFPIRLRVTDTFGRSTVEETNIVIYQNLPQACFEVSANPAACTEEVEFDAGCSRHLHPGHEIVTYEWDLDGDGETDRVGPVVSQAFAQFGVYPVVLRVTDDNVPPRTSTYVLDDPGLVVSEGNLPPNADPGNAYVIDQGDGITLDASRSSDPNAACGDSIVLYEWDLQNDGFYDLSDTLPVLNLTWFQVSGITGTSVTDPLSTEPFWTFKLRVTDSLGASDETEGTLRVYDNSPVACFGEPTGEDGCRDVFTFTADCSSHGHPAHELTAFRWDLDGDGLVDAEGETIEHEFQGFGEYNVTLTVLDDNDPPRQATFTRTVDANAGNQPPTGDPGGPYTVFLGQEIRLDASRSFDPDSGLCGDSIVLYEWGIGEGEYFDKITREPSYLLRWGDMIGLNYPADPATGEPTNPIRLRLTDENGESSIVTTTLTIYTETPYACFDESPNPARCDDEVFFDAGCSGHTNPELDLTRWEWDFDGDGKVDAEGERVAHIYGQNGVYDVRLRVVDEDGNAVSVERKLHVTVDNEPPEADAGGPYAIGPNGTVQLDARASIDPNDDCLDEVVFFRWDIDGDGEFDDLEGDYIEIGWFDVLEMLEDEDPLADEPEGFDHTIILEVEDRAGATATAEATLSILPTHPVPQDTVGGDAADTVGEADAGSGGGGGGGCTAGAPSGSDGRTGAAPFALFVLLALGLALPRLRRRAQRGR